MVILDNKANIRSFGRLKAKNITLNDENLMNNIFPEYELKLEENIDLKKVFNNENKNFLEIGFGFGESIAQRAKNTEDINYIGCEAYIKGVSALVSNIEENNIKNIKIFHGDARILLDKLLDNSLDKIFVLFPDPWPKKRHNKRRIINEEFLKLISNKLKNGGELFFANDIFNYIEWTVERVENNSNFVAKFNDLNKCKISPDWWVQTRYQTKAIEQGRESYFLEWNINK